MQTRFPLIGSRGLSTSMLSSEAGEGSFPSDLLSRKQILTPERDIGMWMKSPQPASVFYSHEFLSV